MIDKTLEELITEIQSELHQVAGPAVQVYSQDMLVKRVNDAFLTFFDDPKITWKRFVDYATYVLDGTTGKATTNVSTLYRDYHHIFAVYPAESDRRLVSWNMQRNPALITGDYPVFVKPTQTAEKVFQVLPVTATGSVSVVGKQMPSTFPFDDLSDTVPFDYLAIKYYVTWQELADDGANPAATENALKLFQNRYDTLEKNQGQEPVAYNGGMSQYPTEWYDPNA
jgi:hypothetical protein